VSPRRITEREVQRILALVPYLVDHPGSAKADVATRFGITVEQLEDDLDLVLMVGVPPYTPGDYIDVWTDGDAITLRMADSFRRPLRLTPSEGLALLSAGRALLAVPGSESTGPLASALEKLASKLDLPELAIDVAAPEHLGIVRDAVEQHARLEIVYWSAGRDDLTERAIDPITVFYALGAWYTSAYCHRAEAERLFRVDRIRAARITGEHFEAHAEPRVVADGDIDLYHPTPNDPRVRLVLAPTAAWVTEVYPTESVEAMAKGRLRVTLAVSNVAWLERLLLELGPAARVDTPREWRDLAQGAARRILKRYTAGGSG
jgi:proteasome accessory factor C